jgi:hypothetical protein
MSVQRRNMHLLIIVDVITKILGCVILTRCVTLLRILCSTPRKELQERVWVKKEVVHNLLKSKKPREKPTESEAYRLNEKHKELTRCAERRAQRTNRTQNRNRTQSAPLREFTAFRPQNNSPAAFSLPNLS